jgi:undecaprenyl-diphosphatase
MTTRTERAPAPVHAQGPPTGPTHGDQTVAWGPTVRGVLLRYVILTTVLTLAGLALVHLGALDWLRDADVRVSKWFVPRRTPFQDDIAEWLSTFADTVMICGVAAVVAVILWLRHRRRDAVLIAFGLALEAATFITANNIVRRERPPVPTVGDSPTTYSFPSGHVAATLVLYGALAILLLVVVRRPVLRAPVAAMAVVLAGAVAWARIYRGMHFALDVIAGVLLGFTVLVVMVRLLPRTTTSFEEVPR